MKDQDRFASRFSAEVDRLLERQGRAESEGPPPEYAGMLDLAEQLSALDFSQDRAVRPRLRRELLDRLEAQIAERHTHTWWARVWAHRFARLFSPPSRRPLAVLVGTAALVMLLWVTPAGQAVAETVRELIWPHTTVQQVQEATPVGGDQAWYQAQIAAGRGWTFDFEGYRFGACCFDQPVRDERVPWERALAEAGFAVRAPTFLPEGWALHEVYLLGVAPCDVLTIYAGPDGRLALYQSWVGPVSTDAGVDVRRMVDVDTEGTVEPLYVGPTQAALLEGEWLVWEAEAVSFYLIGPGLAPEILIQVAESLAPAR